MRAQARIAAYVGFTTAVPSVAAARCALLAGGRQLGLGPAPLRTLSVLLETVPACRWHGDGLPVVQIKNRRLAARIGCSVRALQRHLGLLHERGLVAIAWGPGNMRLCWHEDGPEDGGPDGDGPGGGGAAAPVGIDLRPALVAAGELAAQLQAAERARQTFEAVYAVASEVLLATRAAEAAAVLTDATRAAHRVRLTDLRRRLRATVHPAYRPGATTAEIAVAVAAATAIAGEAETLRHALEPAPTPGPDGEGGDGAADTVRTLSPGHDGGRSQWTGSTLVETNVRTIQGEGRTASKGWDGSDADDDPAEALLLARWRRHHDGTAPLASGDRVELEITTRLRASRMGVGTAALNAGVARHGLDLTMGAVLHVSALPARARVRSKGALLASLLRRPPGQLAPETFHRRPPANPALGEEEALWIARQRAPSHRPDWVLRQWTATRLRRGEPIHDPRRCLEGFAAVLERTQRRAA